MKKQYVYILWKEKLIEYPNEYGFKDYCWETIDIEIYPTYQELKQRFDNIRVHYYKYDSRESYSPRIKMFKNKYNGKTICFQWNKRLLNQKRKVRK